MSLPLILPGFLNSTKHQIVLPSINNMSDPSMAGSLIWNTGSCSDFTATPILPNSTNSPRVCGLQTNNRTLVQPCCGGNDLQTYQCWQYCATDQTLGKFAQCLGRSTNSSKAPDGVFCQSNSSATIRETVTSAGFPRVRSPSLGPLLLAVCLIVFWVTPASAEIVPSLDAGSQMIRRQSEQSSCSFEETQRSVQLGKAIVVSPDFGNVDMITTNIDSGITNNNRTINGSSAAEPTYDAFFDLISDKFGRRFPAMSSAQLTYEAQCGGEICHAAFTPHHWCAEGSVSGCSEELDGNNATMPLTVCGPVFVSDNNATDVQNQEDIQGAMIQGVLSVVVSGCPLAIACPADMIADLHVMSRMPDPHLQAMQCTLSCCYKSRRRALQLRQNGVCSR